MDIKDGDGKIIKEGDVIYFSYGIPPVGVYAPVVSIKGKLVAITKGHKPEQCSLRELKRHVGIFYKVEQPPTETE